MAAASVSFVCAYLFCKLSKQNNKGQYNDTGDKPQKPDEFSFFVMGYHDINSAIKQNNITITFSAQMTTTVI